MKPKEIPADKVYGTTDDNDGDRHRGLELFLVEISMVPWTDFVH